MAPSHRRFEGHTGWVNNVAFSPGGLLIASGSIDGTVRLWEVQTGKEIRRFKGRTGEVSDVAFSPHGRWIASGGVDKTVRLWDVQTTKEIRRFEGHTGWVTSVAFSPDEHLIASGGEEDHPALERANRQGDTTIRTVHGRCEQRGVLAGRVLYCIQRH
jgi:WD40 repeat protein